MSEAREASGELLLAELKARCADLAAIRDRLRNRAAHEATIRQVDTYFAVPRGRLKLREVGGRPAQLIYYLRPDLPAVKASQVHLASVEDGPALRTLLSAAFGIGSSVTKTREIWRWEDVQVHLDTVEGVGTFVEFEELVTGPDAMPGAQTHLRRLMTDLGIRPEDLVDRSYGELVGSRRT
jgi:adenylate cyclase class 2